MVDLTVDAAVVPRVHAPPAITLEHPLHSQIPTLVLFTESFPQKEQVYLELIINGDAYCWVISIFFTCFLNEAPYLVPYFPVTPTFFVRLAISDLFEKNFRLFSRVH